MSKCLTRPQFLSAKYFLWRSPNEFWEEFLKRFPKKRRNAFQITHSWIRISLPNQIIRRQLLDWRAYRMLPWLLGEEKSKNCAEKWKLKVRLLGSLPDKDICDEVDEGANSAPVNPSHSNSRADKLSLQFLKSWSVERTSRVVLNPYLNAIECKSGCFKATYG